MASPLLKQRFDLETGRCLDDEEVAVAVYPVRAALLDPALSQAGGRPG